MYSYSRYILAFFLLVIPFQLSAQLEGWQKVRDPDGNIFYLDRNLKIHTTTEPEDRYKSVAIPESEYDVDQNGTLVKRRYPPEGMRYPEKEKPATAAPKKGDQPAPRNTEDFANNRYFLD